MQSLQHFSSSIKFYKLRFSSYIFSKSHSMLIFGHGKKIADVVKTQHIFSFDSDIKKVECQKIKKHGILPYGNLIRTFTMQNVSLLSQLILAMKPLR